MYNDFKSKAEGVSAEVHQFASVRAATEYIVEFLLSHSIADTSGRYAVISDCPMIGEKERNMLSALPGVRFDVTGKLASEAYFGISQADWALADTGTVAMDSTAIDGRLVSMLPTIHIALVPTAGLLPDMATLLSQLRPEKCAYLAMITGPSRTADIERVLTIGVHGPKRLLIIFVDETGGDI